MVHNTQTGEVAGWGEGCCRTANIVGCVFITFFEVCVSVNEQWVKSTHYFCDLKK